MHGAQQTAVAIFVENGIAYSKTTHTIMTTFAGVVSNAKTALQSM
jgi:hypothetical protein